MSQEQALPMPSLEVLESAVAAQHRKARRDRAFKNTVLYLVAVAALVVLCMVLAFPVLRISGTSMAPTLEEGSLVLTASSGAYEAGDVVAVHHNNALLVKRIVATGGDWVTAAEDGSLLVNGEPVFQASAADTAPEKCDIDLPLQVPDGAFFVLGDDREVSVDSRAKGVGCIDEDMVLGRVMVCLWPLNRLGLVG